MMSRLKSGGERSLVFWAPTGRERVRLIRVLTTLLHPTSGTACVDTYDIIRDPEKIRSIIGVCPQNSTLDVELTAYDNLEFYGKLVNVDDSDPGQKNMGTPRNDRTDRPCPHESPDILRGHETKT